LCWILVSMFAEESLVLPLPLFCCLSIKSVYASKPNPGLTRIARSFFCFVSGELEDKIMSEGRLAEVFFDAQNWG